MHYSNIIIPLLTFASTSSAAPTTDEGSLLHRSAFSSVEIPELANYKLIQKNGMEVYDLPEEGIELSAELYKNLTGEDLPYVHLHNFVATYLSHFKTTTQAPESLWWRNVPHLGPS
jgi:hypothetical protein